MPHDRLPPDSPFEWLNRAESDLNIADASIEGAYLEDLCYHAQQCAEKSLKAVLLIHVGSFPFIHDLSELVNRIQQAEIKVPKYILNSVSLTEFAVEGRYPGLDEPVTENQRKRAVKKAERILKWAQRKVNRAFR